MMSHQLRKIAHVGTAGMWNRLVCSSSPPILNSIITVEDSLDEQLIGAAMCDST